MEISLCELRAQHAHAQHVSRRRKLFTENKLRSVHMASNKGNGSKMNIFLVQEAMGFQKITNKKLLIKETHKP
jgi:hypothetical protein